jgi:hypothetical protein
MLVKTAYFVTDDAFYAHDSKSALFAFCTFNSQTPSEMSTEIKLERVDHTASIYQASLLVPIRTLLQMSYMHRNKHAIYLLLVFDTSY